MNRVKKVEYYSAFSRFSIYDADHIVPFPCPATHAATKSEAEVSLIGQELHVRLPLV